MTQKIETYNDYRGATIIGSIGEGDTNFAGNSGGISVVFGEQSDVVRTENNVDAEQVAGGESHSVIWVKFEDLKKLTESCSRAIVGFIKWVFNKKDEKLLLEGVPYFVNSYSSDFVNRMKDFFQLPNIWN